MHDLTLLAFDLADKYRNPVVILGDAVLGQMQETMIDRAYRPLELPPKDWTLTGAAGRKPRLIKSLYLKEGEMERHNWKLFEKYQRMKKEEVRYETSLEEDAQLMVVAFGTAARVSKTAIRLARAEGLKRGPLSADHPLSLSRTSPAPPFPAGKTFLVHRDEHRADGGGRKTLRGPAMPMSISTAIPRFPTRSRGTFGSDQESILRIFYEASV